MRYPVLDCEDTTTLLARWRRGDDQAGERALGRLYPELRSLARLRLVGANLSLQPSDLLHEVWIRMLKQPFGGWRNRAHFFALVGRMLRRTVCDQQRLRGRLKRKRSNELASLDDVVAAAPTPSFDLVSLDQALERLAVIDPIAVRVVELRYFSGLSFDDTARVLELSRSTAVRRWRYARAWLYDQINDGVE